jgi:PHP family Zn ribbon phosphoesterase
MAKMAVTCNECGKKFKVSPSNSDPRCPKCGGVDVDVDYVSVRIVPAAAARKVVFRNYAAGPFDFFPEAA